MEAANYKYLDSTADNSGEDGLPSGAVPHSRAVMGTKQFSDAYNEFI